MAVGARLADPSGLTYQLYQFMYIRSCAKYRKTA